MRADSEEKQWKWGSDSMALSPPSSLAIFPFFFPTKELGARSTLLRLVGILLGKTVIRSGHALLFAVFLRSWNVSLHQLNSEKIMVQFCYLRALSFCQN